jgi:hypothetical protein
MKVYKKLVVGEYTCGGVVLIAARNKVEAEAVFKKYADKKINPYDHKYFEPAELLRKVDANTATPKVIVCEYAIE